MTTLDSKNLDLLQNASKEITHELPISNLISSFFEQQIIEQSGGAIILHEDKLIEYANQAYDQLEKLGDYSPREANVEDLIAQSYARKAIRLLVSGKYLSAKQALLIGQNFRPSFVKSEKSIAGAEVSSELYITADKAAELNIGFGYHTKDRVLFGDQALYIQLIKDILREYNLPPLDLDLEELVGIVTMAHEYGHIYHSVISRIKAQILEDKTGNEEESQKQKRVIKIFNVIMDSLQVNYPIATPLPKDEISNEDYESEITPYITHLSYGLERISGGFEYAAMKEYLKNHQVGNEYIQVLTEALTGFWQDNIKNYQKERKVCEDHSTTFKYVMRELANIVFKYPENKKLLTLVGSIEGPKEVGYAYPLSEQELRNFTNSYDYIFSLGSDYLSSDYSRNSS